MAALAFFVAAIVLGTLVEYLLHRFVLHSRLRHWAICRHTMHHKKYVAYSVASEFFGFFPAAVPFLWIGFVHSTAAGLAFVAGAVVCVLVVAVAHKWSHEAPHRLFWMNPVVHAVHHADSVRWNFGVHTSFWDRVFGTYRVAPMWRNQHERADPRSITPPAKRCAPSTGRAFSPRSG